MKTGILGGTFDPIHIGHLILADEIREAANLDRVLFIPAFYPPHKSASGMASGEDRLRMTAMAVADNPHFEVSDIELQRRGISYTVNTIEELRRLRPDDQFYFIIGADSLPDLASWHRVNDLMAMCEFVVGNRPGHALHWERLEESLPPEKVIALKNNVIATTAIGISSSMIRERAVNGLSIKYLVPKEVEEYINKNSLYQDKQEVQQVNHEQKHYSEDH